MTDIPTTKEYTEEEVMGLIKAQSLSVKPSEAALRAALAQIPLGTPSPYAPVKSRFFTMQKLAFTMLAIVILVGGGTFYSRNGGTPTAAPQVAMMDADTFSATSPESASRSMDVTANQVATAPNESGDMTTGATPMMMSMKSASAEDQQTMISDDTSDDGLEADEAKIAQQMAALDADNDTVDQSM